MMEDKAKNTAPFEEFTGVIAQLIKIVSSLAEYEEQKAAAAAGSRHELINNFLNPEQALILKMRGLEHRRIRLADVLGWNNLTFSQILELAGGDQKNTLLPLFTDLRKQAERLTAAKNSSEIILSLRLKELKTIIAQETATGYGGHERIGDHTAIHFHDTYI